MSTATADPKEKRASSLAPFTLEADHPRNCDVILKGIPNCRLRGALSAAKSVWSEKDQDYIRPETRWTAIGKYPEVPGMQVQVNPAELTYTIIDPLHNNERLLERIKKAMKHGAGHVPEKLNGVPPRQGTLTVHEMKTLCRELFRRMQNGDMKLVQGPAPTMEAIEQLPGHFLNDPTPRWRIAQPQFEKDVRDWEDRLTRTGM